MKTWPILVTAGLFAVNSAYAAVNVVVVEGLGGEDRYTQQFANQVDGILDAAHSVATNKRIHGFRVDSVTRDAVLALFDEMSGNLQDDDQVIIYLVGHGSFDDHEYKFNIPGPDLTGADIAAILNQLPGSNQVLVNTSAASGAGVENWQSDGRVIIAATRSGVERHAPRFGAYFVAALSDSVADIDKNNIISAREAFDFADRRVADYFDENSQLVTEHARLEGDLADRFSLARLARSREPQDDAQLTTLIETRDAIAARVDELRLARDDMAQDEYQQRLLEGMLELAGAEEAVELREQELSRAQ